MFTIAKAGTNFHVNYVLHMGEPWFRAKEIAQVLGYTNTNKAIIDHVDTEDKQVLQQIATASKSNSSIPLPANSKNTIFINESGLYSLIMRSQMELAKPFQKWVTSEVLPTIRKTGTYDIPQPQPAPKANMQVLDMSKIHKNKEIVITNENQLHYKVVDYIRTYHPHAKMLAACGEFQETPRQRIEGYNKGYQKGCCDLLIVNKHKLYQGMAIEMKTPKGVGKVSDAQQEWLKDTHLNGHKVLISNDYDEIVDEIAKYFEGVRFVCPHCLTKPHYFRTQDSMEKHICAFHKNKTLPLEI